VSRFSDRQEEALQVLEAFATEDVMLTVFELGGFLPPNLELVAEASPDDVGPVVRYADVVQSASENAIPATGDRPLARAVGADIPGSERGVPRRKSTLRLR